MVKFSIRPKITTDTISSKEIYPVLSIKYGEMNQVLVCNSKMQLEFLNFEDVNVFTMEVLKWDRPYFIEQR